MFKRYLLSGAVAVLCSAAMTSAQTPTTGASPQVPPSGQQQRPTTSQPASPAATTTDRASMTTLVGCLVREQDVPGHSPNVAERAGVLEDYILTSVSAGSAAGAVGTSGSATPGAIGTAGSASMGSMYKIEGISDTQLKSLVGKRVEVIGELDKDDARRESAAASPSAASPGAAPQAGAAAKTGGFAGKDDWAEFKAASIKEVSGSCPSPAANR